MRNIYENYKLSEEEKSGVSCKSVLSVLFSLNVVCLNLLNWWKKSKFENQNLLIWVKGVLDQWVQKPATNHCPSGHTGTTCYSLLSPLTHNWPPPPPTPLLLTLTSPPKPLLPSTVYWLHWYSGIYRWYKNSDGAGLDGGVGGSDGFGFGLSGAMSGFG